MTQPIELWIEEAVSPTLVIAAMSGGSDAYEEFVVRPLDDGGCEAILTLWVTLPDGLSEESWPQPRPGASTPSARSSA